MNIQKITLFRKQLLLLLFFVQAVAFAQQPTITSFSPTVVTYRTVITVTGTNFPSSLASTGTSTAIKFNGVGAVKVVWVSATQLKVTVPSVTAAATNFVITASGTGIVPVTSGAYVYKVPTSTTSAAAATRIITNWNGYWSSTATSATASLQPDDQHSLVGFKYNNVLYSTGDESAITSVLATGGFTSGDGVAANTYKLGNYRALPVSDLQGTIGSANYIVLGSKIDNNASQQVPTAPSVAGLKIRDVLIDGIRGLGIGSGVTNLPAESVLLFQATDIVGEGISDGVPDILVSQAAEVGSTDIFSFVDANGNIVGNPVQVTFGNVAAVGTYKTDFFTLPSNQPLNTAVVNGSTLIGSNTRDLRLVAYQLTDFGIDTTNKAQAVSFKVMPSGSSDPAFLAYNRNSFQVPAPEITGEPSSQVSCIGGSSNFSVSVQAVGTELTFQWKKNGVDLVNNGVVSGATSTTLSINPISAQYVGTYTCVITNTSNGTQAITSPVYLNAAISSISPTINVCQNQTQTIEVGAQGASLAYKWYSTTLANTYIESGDANGNGISGERLVTDPTLGTLVSGTVTTSSTYSPSNTVIGTRYFYVKVYNSTSPLVNGEPCTSVISSAVTYNVGSGAVAGTASSSGGICAGSSATLTITGSVGTIQWQQSADNVNWVNVTTGSGYTTATFTTAALTANTFYKALVTSANGSCNTLTNTVGVAVNSTTTWTGATNDQWNTPTNWSCGTVPTVVNDVVIPGAPANQPHVNGVTGRAKSLSVSSGASVIVDANGTLDIANGITVAATGAVTVQNNASLIQDNASATNSGNVTVKKNSNALYRLDYTMWSSPVTGQQLQSFSPITSPTRFYEYGAIVNGSYVDQFTVTPNALANFETAKGYLIRMPNTITGGPTGPYFLGTQTLVFNGVFTGVPNTGTINHTLNSAGNHYTATGNPYPSPIGVKAFLDANASVLASGSGIYFWRKKNDSNRATYATLTLTGLVANAGTQEVPTGPATAYAYGGQDQAVYYAGGTANNANWIISPGQGFLVQSNASLNSPQLIFNNTMRKASPTSGGQPFFKNGQLDEESSRFWLNLASETGFSQILVGYLDGATLGMDFGYDGKRLADTGTAELYTTVEDNNLAIQARPSFEASDVVPVGYAATTAGQYTFTLDHSDGVFANGQNIFLKDKLMGTTHEISDSAYTFATEAGTFANRFEILYLEPLSTDNPVLSANNVVVYQQGSTINVLTGNVEMTSVSIYDIRGRKIYTQDNINATETTITNLQAQHEVLIVEVNTLNGKVTKKIVF